MTNINATHYSSDNELLGSNILTGAAILASWLVVMALVAGPAPLAAGATQTAANTPVQEMVVVTARHLS